MSEPVQLEFSPLTTRGDILYRGASGDVRLPAGTAGQFLQTNGSGADPGYGWAPFPVVFGAGDAAGINLAASSTYYFGQQYSLDPALADDQPGYIVPVACRLIAARARVSVAGVVSSAHNNSLILRKNGTTDIRTLTSNFQFTLAKNIMPPITGLSDALAAEDELTIKLVTGAYTTAPTFVFVNVSLLLGMPGT